MDPGFIEIAGALVDIAERNNLNLTDEFNYTGDGAHSDRGPILFWFNLALFSVTLIFCSARLYCRRFIAGGLGSDDYTIIVATFICGSSTALNCWAVKHAGIGKHIYAIDLDTLTRMLKVTYCLPIVYSFGVLTIKVSVLLFYARLFKNDIVMLRIIKWFNAFQIIFTSASCLGLLLMCHPIRGWWIVRMRVHSCPTFKETLAIWASFRTVTVICDFIVLCLPLKMVWKLKLPGRQKVGLTVVLTVGVIACAVAVARLALLPNLLLRLDASWNVMPVALLDQAEQCLGIITASMPALAAIISRFNRHVSKKCFSDPGEGRETPGSKNEFDFLSFVYDPDHTTGGFTTIVTGGAPSSGRRRLNLGRITPTSQESLVMRTLEDAELPGSPPPAMHGIKQTTTVTVNVDRR